MTGIEKSFPGVRALDGVDLEVAAGEVHCLLGQNGAGKSTLIKVLAGVHRPDAGTVTLAGEPVVLTGPAAALRAGIATMYQELDLAPWLSVAENVFLGSEPSRGGFVRYRHAHRRAAEILAGLGHPELDPHAPVAVLPPAARQLVSMARALAHDASIIVMDEPSAALADDEVDNLFRVIGELTAAGVAVVYISHRMAEIRRIGHRVTVLKDGRTVAAGLPAATPAPELVGLMTGRRWESAFPDRAPVAVGPDPVLEVAGLSRHGEFADVSLSVRPGEVVGLTGLVGAGRTEVLETIAGARRPDAGRILVDGREPRPGSVRAAVRAGIGLVPEERKSQGLVPGMSVARNLTLASLGGFSTAGFLRRGAETGTAAGLAERLGLRPADPHRTVGTLSGGNQQKVVVGRWLVRDTRVLLLDEPTRGVDVGARSQMYELIGELAAAGMAVLLVSSEVPEVLGLADRVLVLREGRVVARAAAGEIDESDVLRAAMEGSVHVTEENLP
ncbi:sugar ABC transporter ATP-binding protein [Pseudonocardia sp. HH130630-07]|uniref:sugar ABC transporter ATP-binding protein n=1 Tax=Pseudonocardia sp. HH130630-07 TaxID=1690815 RepID=UPI000814FF1D|nr:sugar ABC transporter ATP-binding protein [Pseudonocardia sp. HH130630-07]ANY06169.1 sugar ABC transporter ATP-binding protein [Pseudonocardia sp. HH130630-07]